MVPCGENVPHTHPRATELLSLISGGPLQAGFVDTKGYDICNLMQVIIGFAYVLDGYVNPFPDILLLDHLTAGQAQIHILYPGDLIVFPRGLLHFELNVGTETAFYLSALNSQNPGTLVSLLLYYKL